MKPATAAIGAKVPLADEEGVRGRIFAAARQEFARFGLRGASVREISSLAGVTPAMINYHFRGKLGLYHEVVEEAMGRLMGHLSGALARGTSEELAPLLVSAYFDFLCEEQNLQRLLMHEVLASGEVLPGIVGRHLVPLMSLLQGRFGGGDATFQTAVSLFGAVAGYFLYAPVLHMLTGEDPLSPEQLRLRQDHIETLTHRLSPLGESGKEINK